MNYAIKVSYKELEQINDGLQGQIVELKDQIRRRNIQIKDLKKTIKGLETSQLDQDQYGQPRM